MAAAIAWTAKNSIVVPVDFSDESWRAVRVAAGMVKSPSRLHVIHVLAPLSTAQPEAAWDRPGTGRRHQAEARLRAGLQALDLTDADAAVVVGDPAEQIADFARSLAAELIVLPSHGRTGLSRLLIGSVAERVVRLAPCPVLVLKHGPETR